LSSTTDSTMRAALSASEKVAVTCSTVPAPGASEGAVLLARTVMIGVPVATLDCTTTLPPKIGCSAVRSAVTPTASVIRPLPVLTARRARPPCPRCCSGGAPRPGSSRHQLGEHGGLRAGQEAVELLGLADVDLLGAVRADLLGAADAPLPSTTADGVPSSRASVSSS
jgi:hypothetical protein